MLCYDGCHRRSQSWRAASRTSRGLSTEGCNFCSGSMKHAPAVPSAVWACPCAYICVNITQRLRLRCWSPIRCWRRLATPRRCGTTTRRDSGSLWRSSSTRLGASAGLLSGPTCWSAPGLSSSPTPSATTTSSTRYITGPYTTIDSMMLLGVTLHCPRANPSAEAHYSLYQLVHLSKDGLS